MKKILTLISAVLIFSISGNAQQYAHSTGSTTVDWGNVNGYPFSSGLNKVQWLYKSTMFATAPSGNVTKLYFRAATTGSRTFQDLTIKMAPTALVEFPTSLAFETQGFVTVFQAASHTVAVQEGQWFEITLQTPFPFANGQNFIVEISKTGSSGQVLAAYTPETYKGHVGATTATALIGNTSLNKVGQLGMDITAISNVTLSGPDTLCLSATSTYLGNPSGGTWSSSNNSILSVNSSGIATGSAVGSAILTYTSGSGSTTKNVYVKSPVMPTITLSASPNDTICEGNAITINAAVLNGGATPYYAWKINNNATPLPNNAPILTYTPGTMGASNVKVIVTSSLACSGTDSVTIPIYVVSGQNPSVTITSNVAGSACPGTNVTFTANPTNGGTAPTYQWKKNGTNVGTNSATYSDATLTNTDAITCEMISNLVSPCVSGAAVVSNAISISFSSQVTLTLVLSLNPNSVCEGSNVTATVFPTNGGGSPGFEWFVNNVSVSNSGTAYTFAPNIGDDVFCVMTSNANCVTNAVVHSDTLSTTVNPSPVVTITLSQGVLSSSANSGNQWYKNGVAIPGATAQTYTPTADGDYHVVVTVNGCEGTSNILKYQGTSIKGFALQNELKLYPNPANSTLTIENASELKLKSIIVSNILGQQLLEQGINSNKTNVNIATLPIGLYNIKFIFEEGEVNRKFSVVK